MEVVLKFIINIFSYEKYDMYKLRMGEYFFKGIFEEQWFFGIKNYSNNKI